MAEEKDKQKPKATLIKHRKPEPAKPVAEDKQERKKVVVVKKKVKKATPKIVTHSDSGSTSVKSTPVDEKRSKTEQKGTSSEASVKSNAAGPVSAGSRTQDETRSKPVERTGERKQEDRRPQQANRPPYRGDSQRSGGYQGGGQQGGGQRPGG